MVAELTFFKSNPDEAPPSTWRCIVILRPHATWRTLGLADGWMLSQFLYRGAAGSCRFSR